MVTVGRRPNTDDLGLEQAGVEIGERGLIPVDNQGRTNVKTSSQSATSYQVCVSA